VMGKQSIAESLFAIIDYQLFTVHYSLFTIFICF